VSNRLSRCSSPYTLDQQVGTLRSDLHCIFSGVFTRGEEGRVTGVPASLRRLSDDMVDADFESPCIIRTMTAGLVGREDMILFAQSRGGCGGFSMAKTPLPGRPAHGQRAVTRSTHGVIVP